MSGLGIGIACFSTFGGSGVIAAEVGMSLARRGHRVCFVSDGVPGRLDVGQANVSFHQVALREHPALKHNPYTLALASAMVELAQREALDLLHVHYAIPHAVSAYLARQILLGGAGGRAPKIVTTLHGTDITLVGVDPSFLSLTRFAILASDGLTTPSAWLRETTYRNFDIPRGVAIDVVPNFVDTDRFCPPRDRGAARAAGAGARPTLVHVSNFRPVKRVDDVVKIFARVRAQLPAAELCLVGDGPDRPAIEALCRSAGVAADVRFLGETVDLPEVLRGSDVFLLPSETESFGLAALEAMSCGVPVVASDVGGLPEVVVHGETGFLAPPGDVTAMAAAVLRVLTDGALASRLGRAARARAEARFPIEPAVDRYEAVYRRVLAAP